MKLKQKEIKKKYMLRCKGCRSRFSSFTSLIEHERRTKHKLCNCSPSASFPGGYHFVHRPGSRYCQQNPLCDYWIALKEGASKEQLIEILVEWAWAGKGLLSRGGPPPF